ncbi:MAG: hypothetical protein HZB18_17110 [Chloroflexi bacterium]|nr:hypothetical protein [Chloroflexota bacterium]
MLDLILGDQVVVGYDNRILGEYEEVLSRQEFHIHPPKAFAIVNHIEVSGHYIESEKRSIEGFTDPDDIMFTEVFITSDADALVWARSNAGISARLLLRFNGVSGSMLFCCSWLIAPGGY